VLLVTAHHRSVGPHTRRSVSQCRSGTSPTRTRATRHRECGVDTCMHSVMRGGCAYPKK
jgi:hypothetical protein